MSLVSIKKPIYKNTFRGVSALQCCLVPTKVSGKTGWKPKKYPNLLDLSQQFNRKPYLWNALHLRQQPQRMTGNLSNVNWQIGFAL